MPDNKDTYFKPVAAVRITKDTDTDELLDKLGDLIAALDDGEDDDEVTELDTSAYEQALQFMQSTNAVIGTYASHFDGEEHKEGSYFNVVNDLVTTFPRVLKAALSFEVIMADKL